MIISAPRRCRLSQEQIKSKGSAPHYVKMWEQKCEKAVKDDFACARHAEASQERSAVEARDVAQHDRTAKRLHARPESEPMWKTETKTMIMLLIWGRVRGKTKELQECSEPNMRPRVLHHCAMTAVHVAINSEEIRDPEDGSRCIVDALDTTVVGVEGRLCVQRACPIHASIVDAPLARPEPLVELLRL